MKYLFAFILFRNCVFFKDMEQYVFKWLRIYDEDGLKCNEDHPDFDHTQVPDIVDEWK